MRKYIFMLLFSVLIISCGKEEIIKNEEKDGLCGYPKKKNMLKNWVVTTIIITIL